MRKKKVDRKNIDFKVFSNVKDHYFKCVKIFGVKVFEELSNNTVRIQKIAGDLIYTKRFRTATKLKKTLKLFNLPISERITENDIVKYKLFGFTYKKTNLQNVFYDKYLKNIEIDYDDAYILNGNSGEIYLFFAYCAKAFLNKNNSKKPLFIATQNCHVDIVKMYFPNAKIILLSDINLKAQSDRWFINNHNYYIIFSPVHFANVENEIREKSIGEVHYLYNIIKTLNITNSEFSKPIVEISQEVEQSLNEKLKCLDLNLNNFIILAPEARTCEALPHSLWCNIANTLKKKGVDVFLNIVDKENFIDGCKTTFLTYREVYQLAEKAKAVISLRSGFTEFLVPCEIPNITVYTMFRGRGKKSFSIEKASSAFSMRKFPFVNHDLICELNINDFKNENELFTSIINNLDNMTTKEMQAI